MNLLNVKRSFDYLFHLHVAVFKGTTIQYQFPYNMEPQ